MSQYFIHNGYSGWSYGTPSDPQLISVEDASRLMQAANLSPDQVALIVPAAQYAATGEKLFELTGSNRFLFHGGITSCVDVTPDKVTAPLIIDWAAA